MDMSAWGPIIGSVIVAALGAIGAIRGAKATATRTINDGWRDLTTALRSELNEERCQRERLEGRLQQVEEDRAATREKLAALQAQYSTLEAKSRERETSLQAQITLLQAQVRGYEREIERLKSLLAGKDRP